MNNCALNLSATVIATAQPSTHHNRHRHRHIVSPPCNYGALCLFSVSRTLGGGWRLCKTGVCSHLVLCSFSQQINLTPPGENNYSPPSSGYSDLTRTSQNLSLRHSADLSGGVHAIQTNVLHQHLHSRNFLNTSAASATKDEKAIHLWPPQALFLHWKPH